MDVRPYEPSDRDTCLDIFDSLTPALLESTARPSFESWLDSVADRYFVMEHEETMVGCGGYSVSPEGSVATLRWGMIRRSFQKMGLGRFLLMYRIREIGKESTVSMAVAQVPPPSAGFFEKQGFRRNGECRDSGTHCVELVKKLVVCP